MMPRISLDEFRKIKDELNIFFNESNNYYEDNRYNSSFNLEIYEEAFITRYQRIFNRLLIYDLSSIPFEEWNGINIIASDKHKIDLSKTKANIDFEIVEYNNFVNYKECNVRNLDKIGSYIIPDNFDDETINKNQHLFLSNQFNNEFKDKYYSHVLTISDLANLSNVQIKELEEKQLLAHFNNTDNNSLMFETLGIAKMISLYNYSYDVYNLVHTILTDVSLISYSRITSDSMSLSDFMEQIRNANISEIKDICYTYIRNNLLFSKNNKIEIDKLPDIFVRENSDILLTNSEISNDLRERFYERKLTIDDVIANIDLFQNIPIGNFMESNIIFDNLGHYFENETINRLLKEHPKLIKHLVTSDDGYDFINYLNKDNNSYESFIEAIKQYFMDNYINSFNYTFRIPVDGKMTYNVPEWLKAMDFNFIEEVTSPSDLMNCDLNTIILNANQQKIINILGIENIKRFNRETGFFSHKTYEYSSGLEMFDALTSYFNMRFSVINNKLNFKNGTLSYEEFKNELAKCLDIMRSNNVFTDYPNYDFIEGKFRLDHPEIFLAKEAPKELREAFYKNNITAALLFNHREYISYLLDKNMENTINIDMKLRIPGMYQNDGKIILNDANFVSEYVKRYGNQAFLDLITTYGDILNNVGVLSIHNEIESKMSIERNLRNAIYQKIVKSRIDYKYLVMVDEFVNEHKDIFLDLKELDNLDDKLKDYFINAFYDRKLTFDDIKEYPELVNILKDKNLQVAFGEYRNNNTFGLYNSRSNKYDNLELINVIGNEKFLALCQKYGEYMDNHMDLFGKNIEIKDNKCYDYSGKEINFDEIDEMYESILYREILFGRMDYAEEAPDYLKERDSSLFLDDFAPEELKKFFYNKNGNPLTFNILSTHKEWVPYLENKAVETALLRGTRHKEAMNRYFNIFGKEKAIKFGITRTDTVMAMINANQVDLMKKWYDKTGSRFIPDVVVMQNFPFEEADKFLTSGVNWSNLMKIRSFSNEIEPRDAMLKLAYSFGAFDGDNRGYKKLYDLLTGIPKHISKENANVIENINKVIELYNTPELAGGDYYTLNSEIIDRLQKSLLSEKINTDIRKNGFNDIYWLNEDGSYTLVINEQNTPKSCEIIRNVLDEYESLTMLTPDKAHKLFGGFILKYDPKFREFLLNNMDEILKSPEYATYISSIQKQFDDIRIANSNRTLTLDLAISYVKENKYIGVDVGNERVSEVASIAGYTQQDFNILQQIYNYGKQRTFSSIPRIAKTTDKYSYEFLRLDDPLAMAVGTLSDCCQELRNVAEVCMEHSMTSTDGRVFLVRDNEGNIVAQSWVWRNGDVICFDNIEIPEKAFARAKKQDGEHERSDFTDEVFNIYKDAAHDLMIQDEKVYKELLDSGKITKEVYDHIRLGKVTVGLGYNDIAVSIKENAKKDDGILARPPEYHEPVKLSRGLYTSDSTTQYILEERSDRLPSNSETLPVHHDEYIVYDDSNFNKKSLLTLEKLEAVTVGNTYNLDTAVSEYAKDGTYIKEIGDNCGLNSANTKIVMNPNFAIIYEVSNNKIKIGKLLFNTQIDNKEQQIDITDKVVMQIRLAIEQIKNNKEIDISMLNAKQKEIYEKAMNLTTEMDDERGVGHAR